MVGVIFFPFYSRGGETRLTFLHDLSADSCKRQHKHRANRITQAMAEKCRLSMFAEAQYGSAQRVGKQALESQRNGSNPCSEMLDMLLLAVNFNVELLI